MLAFSVLLIYIFPWFLKLKIHENWKKVSVYTNLQKARLFEPVWKKATTGENLLFDSIGCFLNCGLRSRSSSLFRFTWSWRYLWYAAPEPSPSSLSCWTGTSPTRTASMGSSCPTTFYPDPRCIPRSPEPLKGKGAAFQKQDRGGRQRHGGVWRTMHCRLCIKCYRTS